MKKKIFLSLVSIMILAVCITMILIKPWAKDSGKITIVIGEGNELITEEVNYTEGDTLSGIIIEKFDAKFEGTMLKSIMNYYHDDNAHKYIAIYVNDVYSMVGIYDIVLADGSVYKFVLEVW